jgi:citrate lyase subunit beta/citryl-CoA lyase
MRSLLFVPGDSLKKLDKALTSGADALILDLEDSVAPARKSEARRLALAFLQERRSAADRPLLYVRINGFDTPFSEGDLDAVMPAAPDGIMLPKCRSGSDVMLLDSRLAVREALHGIEDGKTRILALATETAGSIFGAGTYAGSSARLAGLSWGAEDLAADIGALASRNDGDWTEPFRLVRSLCLFGAAAAGVAAIDSVYTDFRDLDGLKRESAIATRDGFSGKLAIHPAQVPLINQAFTPSPAALDRAEKIVAAFAESAGLGVTSLDGMMLDQPHLKSAERLLAQAGRKRS